MKIDERGRVVVDQGHYATNVTSASGRSVTSSPGQCWRTRPRMRALRSWNAGRPAGRAELSAPFRVWLCRHLSGNRFGRQNPEEELKAAGIAYNVGKFPFTANGRAKVNHDDRRLREDDRRCQNRPRTLVPATSIGADAGKYDRGIGRGDGNSALSAEDIARTSHAHPTLPEAVEEAAMAVAKRDPIFHAPCRGQSRRVEMAESHKDKDRRHHRRCQRHQAGLHKRLAEDGVHVAVVDIADGAATVKMVEVAGRKAIAVGMRRVVTRCGGRCTAAATVNAKIRRARHLVVNRAGTLSRRRLPTLPSSTGAK